MGSIPRRFASVQVFLPLGLPITPQFRRRRERWRRADTRKVSLFVIGERVVSRWLSSGLRPKLAAVLPGPLPIALRAPRGAPDTVPEPDAEGEAVEARFLKGRLRRELAAREWRRQGRVAATREGALGDDLGARDAAERERDASSGVVRRSLYIVCYQSMELLIRSRSPFLVCYCKKHSRVERAERPQFVGARACVGAAHSNQCAGPLPEQQRPSLSSCLKANQREHRPNQREHCSIPHIGPLAKESS